MRKKMKLIKRLSNSNIETQYELFQQGVTVRNKDIHISNTATSVIVHEQQVIPLLRYLKQRLSKIIH